MTTSLADYCRDRRSTDTALTGGTWQRQGLVMVWAAYPQKSTATHASGQRDAEHGDAGPMDGAA